MPVLRINQRLLRKLLSKVVQQKRFVQSIPKFIVYYITKLGGITAVFGTHLLKKCGIFMKEEERLRREIYD